MTSITLTEKDPLDVVSYSVTFSGDGIGSETIATSNVTGSSVTIDSQTHSGQTVSFTVSGGTARHSAKIEITITTSGGNTINRSAALPVVSL